jgi:hypothetical protein
VQGLDLRGQPVPDPSHGLLARLDEQLAVAVAADVEPYGSTPKEARAKASAVREQLRANLPARDRKVTLGVFAAEWIDSTLAASDRKASTKAMYATMARQHIIGGKIGGEPLTAACGEAEPVRAAV